MRTRLVLLGGQTIALGLMMAFLVVPASALFLDEYGADALPYAYLAVALAGVLVTFAMTRAQRRLSLSTLAAVVLWSYIAVVTVAWVVLATSGEPWVTFPLLVLFPLSIPTGFALVGSQAGRLLDVRQMKASFPRVVAGFSVGFAVGGIAAAALVAPLGGPVQLLAVDIAAALAMVALVTATGRRFPAQLRSAPEHTAPTPANAARPRWVLLRNRLVLMIFGYQMLSAAVTQLLDYMVWERAAARYPDPSDLAQFQGVFGAIINIVSIVFVVALAGWMLSRFGIGLGLAANPLGVLVLLVVTALVGYSSGTLALGFFVLVCAQQVTDIALTDGTTRTSINATYQALLPQQRLQAQTMIEGAGVPLSLGLVGVVLIAIDSLGLGIHSVVLVTLLLTVVWAASAVLAYREYGVNLRDVLARRAWDPVALRIDDDASRAVIDELLTSGDPLDTETALDALVDAGEPDVSDHVAALLADDDPERRRLGIGVAAAGGRRGSAVLLDAVPALLDDPDRAVRLTAAAALAGLHEGPRETARSLWLEALAGDDQVALRIALDGAAKFPARFFTPYLVGLASSPGAPGELVEALVAHAEQLLPVIDGLLGDSALPRGTRLRLLHALGESGSPASRDVLVAHLADGDAAVVDAAARALAAVGHQEDPDGLEVQQALTTLAGRVNRSLSILELLDNHAGAEPLRGALADEVHHAARSAEVLLSLAHDPRAIGSGIAGLSDTGGQQGSALEMLEVTLGRTTAQLVRAIVGDGFDATDRRSVLDAHAPAEHRSLTEWLRELVLDEDRYWHEPWLQACALFAMPSQFGAAAVELSGRLVADADPDVAETARWVGEVVGQPGGGTPEPVVPDSGAAASSPYRLR